MNNKTEHFLALMFLVALAYVCINCGMSFIDLRSKPQSNVVQQQSACSKLESIVISYLMLTQHATLGNAVDFFKKISQQHGCKIQFDVKLEDNWPSKALPKIQVYNISLYDALKLCCDAANCSFEVKDNIVKICSK